MLKRFVVLITVLFTLSLMAGCSNQAKKPTQDVVMTQRAIAAIERIASAYSERQMAEIERLCSAEVYASIAAGMKEFKKAELDVSPDWVDIDDSGRVSVRAIWRGKWSLSGGGTQITESDRAEFIFDSADRMRLVMIKGASPFAAPYGQR